MSPHFEPSRKPVPPSFKDESRSLPEGYVSAAAWADELSFGAKAQEIKTKAAILRDGIVKVVDFLLSGEGERRFHEQISYFFFHDGEFDEDANRINWDRTLYYRVGDAIPNFCRALTVLLQGQPKLDGYSLVELLDGAVLAADRNGRLMRPYKHNAVMTLFDPEVLEDPEASLQMKMIRNDAIDVLLTREESLREYIFRKKRVWGASTFRDD